MSFSSQTFDLNGQSIHTMQAGPESAPVMLMLHGFPESWKAWATVADHLSDTFRVILPDQRGFNLSSKPEGREAYETTHLVADMMALLDAVAPDQQVILCGHDWGASIAYAMAMRHADRISHLIIANGVHPMCFQRALLAGGAQTDASQYMLVLRAEDSEQRLSANKFEKLLRMLDKFSAAPWLTHKLRDEYRSQWSIPGALTAMLNWYRSARMDVPVSGSAPVDFPITDEMTAKYHIVMPHLLLWGLQDTALLPEARADLPAFCDHLELHEAEDASHWILHEKPDWVAKHIRAFVS